jgi:hypothetical protein
MLDRFIRVGYYVTTFTNATLLLRLRLFFHLPRFSEPLPA